jgi:CHAP domain
VGCGAVAGGQWASTNMTIKSPSTVTSDRTMNTVCYENAGPAAVRCSWPPLGTARPPSAGNPGQPMNCTWWAAERLLQHIGWYPGWGGNAKDWATNAANAGWTVRPEPMERAIVVLPSSNPNGHVAWVEHVEYHADGAYIYISEMNANGLANSCAVTYRLIKHQVDFRYILSP